MIENINDVINRLEVIKNLGWVKTLRAGSTGIGYTLETLLDIKENNFQQPDLLGFELKSSRHNGASMLTMFTLSPNPPRSNSKLREKYGYISAEYENERKVLHATLSTQRFTEMATGINLKVIEHENKIHIATADEIEEIYWCRERIQKAFNKKIKNSIIMVKAETRGSGVDEHFLFNEVYLLSGFDFEHFMKMIVDGKIFIDLRIGQHRNGKTHDHGTAFRIKASDQIHLFKNIQKLI